MRLLSLLAAPILLFVFNAPGMGAELKPEAMIAIPGVPVDVFGAMFVDPSIRRAFLTDRSNKAIDVIDTEADKFLSRVTGFVGVAATGNVSGPQGVVTTNDGTEVWATDGDSTVKVIDLATGKIVDTISTGGKQRTGEVAYDPRDKVVLVTNPDETPQYVTLISTEPGHKIIAKLVLANATEGLERPAYSPQTGLFYVPVPSLDKARTAGGLAEIDPRSGNLVALRPTEHCNPHSLAIISENRVIMGCNYGAPDSTGDRGQLLMFDLVVGKNLETGAGLGGDGQTAADLTDGLYFAAANKNPGGPVLKVVDVRSLRQLQTINTWDGSHSVAVNDVTNRVYLPTAAKTGPCGGCIEVYAPDQ